MLIPVLVLTIGLVGVFLILGMARRQMASSAFWFVALTVVFFLWGFSRQWVRAGYRETHPLADGLLVHCLGLVFVIIGASVVSVLARRPSELAKRRYVPQYSDSGETFPFLILSVSVLIPAWMYFYFLGTIPLLPGISAVAADGYGGLGELQAARLANTPHLSGQQIPLKGVLDLMRNYGILFVLGLATVRFFEKKQKWISGLVATACVLTAIAGGQRWQLVYVMMTLVISLSLARSRGAVIPRRWVRAGFSAIVVLAFLLTLLQHRTEVSVDGFFAAVRFSVDNLLNRILYEQSITPILSFSNGVYSGGQLQGSSYLQAVMAYLPGSDMHAFEVDFFQAVYGGNVAFTAAPGFFTEAFYNFGFVGVCLVSFIWGALLSLIDLGVDERGHLIPADLMIGGLAMMAGTSFAGLSLVLSFVLVVSYLVVVRSVAQAIFGVPRRTALRKSERVHASSGAGQ